MFHGALSKATEFLIRLNFDWHSSNVKESLVVFRAAKCLDAITQTDVTVEMTFDNKDDAPLMCPASNGRTMKSAVLPLDENDIREQSARASWCSDEWNEDGSVDASIPGDALRSMRALVFYPAGNISRRMHETKIADKESFPQSWADTLGTIILVHGMASSGMRDNRMLSVARALACLGFTALVPQFDDLTKCLITVNTLDDIAWCVVAVSRGWHHRPVSLFSACIAAGFTLCAVTRQGMMIQDCVQAVMCIGAYADVYDVIMSTMIREESDDYGRNAMMYNFLRYSMPMRPQTALDFDEQVSSGVVDGNAYCSDELSHAFYLAMEDSHLARRGTDQEQLPKYFQELRERELLSRCAEGTSGTKTAKEHAASSVERLYNRLHHDIEFRRTHALAMAKHPGVRSIIDQCQPAHSMTHAPIHFLVALVHGEHDDIVPANESRVLYRALMQNPNCTIRPSCEITSLLRHGDQERVRLSDIPNFFRLVAVFRSFFACAMQHALPVKHPLNDRNMNTNAPENHVDNELRTIQTSSLLVSRFSACFGARRAEA